MERDIQVPETIEVYVRSLSPTETPQQQTLFNQLNAFSAEGVIDYWTVHVVGNEICPDTAKTTQTGDFICERFQEFKAWADRHDRSLGSFFNQREVTSKYTGEEYETMVVPTVTLAEFDENGTLQFVAPSSEGDTHQTPTSRVEDLAERQGEAGILLVSHD